MKYYLSSFGVGDHGLRLKEMVGDRKLAYIPNALDNISLEKQTEWRERNQRDLKEFGIDSELFDLQSYFDDSGKLVEDLSRFAGVWVTGGNTFVLRQAMSLSGFDESLGTLGSDSFIYSGYSAGVCILAPDLKALQIVDKPDEFPYPQQQQVIWQGLGVLKHLILPHYQSDHSESAAIDQEVAYCKKNGIPFKTLRDGEALFGYDIELLNRGVQLNPP